MHQNRLCLCLTGKSLAENLALVERYKPFVDLLELRGDFLPPTEQAQLARFPGLVDLPVILTLRRTADGGQFKDGEHVRQQLLFQVFSTADAASNPTKTYAYLDVEDDIRNHKLEQLARKQGARIIRSFHDFSGLRTGLKERIQALWHDPTDIPKAAVMLQSTADLVKLVETSYALKHLSTAAEQHFILLGMGPFGMATRILAGRLGSFLTYTSATDQQQAAPGHLDPVVLQETYRYRQLNEQTQIYGIIGNPIVHSFSPYIHNPGLAACGLNAVYLPFQADKLPDFFKLAELLPIQAASVTIPHKEVVRAWLTGQDAGCQVTGACNTIKRSAPSETTAISQWQGINTDIDGFIAPLKQLWGGRIPAGKKATVLGAGGSARAVVYALTRAGIQVLVLNRTASRAEELARSFSCEWGDLAKSLLKANTYNDIIIQTTSVGMSPHIQDDPFPEYTFKGHEVVYDIIYNPHLTHFLARAEQSGCQLIFGIDMLIQQALLQFHFFTGCAYPHPENIKKYLPGMHSNNS